MRWRIVLIPIVLVAAVALWRWSGGGTGATGPDAGGALLARLPERLTAMEIRKPVGTTTVEHEGTHWRLTGAVTDYVDSTRVARYLGSLTDATGGAVIPGSVEDASRFGFGGEGSLEIALHFTDGTPLRLAFGAVNPVTGLCYARGLGRSGVFPVTAALHDLWNELPDGVRMTTILPPFARDDVDTLRLRGRGATHATVIARHDGRWWVRVPDAGVAVYGAAIARYQSLYEDRRREENGVTWLLGDSRALASLVYEVSANVVKEFLPLDADPGFPAQVGLDPFYRRVTLVLGSRPDQPYVVDLGEGQPDHELWVRRLRTVLKTSSTALNTVELPASALVDMGAFTFRLATADSFHLDQPGAPVLWGRARPDSAGAWRATDPPGYHLRMAQAIGNNYVHDVQVTLDRLPATAVLDPSPGDPLAPERRTTITAWSPDGHRFQVVIGRLVADDRAAVWDPATGKLLRLPDEILVTLRNLRDLLEAE